MITLLEQQEWRVEPFGGDCYGNISGYRVQRYGWYSNPASCREDGLSWGSETARQFFGDCYVQGSFEKAKSLAASLRDRLNSEIKSNA